MRLLSPRAVLPSFRKARRACVQFTSLQASSSIVACAKGFRPSQRFEKATRLGTEIESRPTILIVDDNVTNLKVLLSILRDRGFDTRPATRAQQAFKMLSHQVPDLVLLDINMPDMDGFELCRRLRSDARTTAVPVLFLSAYSGEDIAAQCRAVGGNAYVTKPVDCDEVVQRVDELLAQLPGNERRDFCHSSSFDSTGPT